MEKYQFLENKAKVGDIVLSIIPKPSDNRAYISIEFYDDEIISLLDTGAHVSCLGQYCLDLLSKYKIKLDRTNRRNVTTADDKAQTLTSIHSRRGKTECHHIFLENLKKAPSFSPWNSPVPRVNRADGEFRFCFDERSLNELNKDSYPLPSIDDVPSMLSHTKYISTIDLKSASWQISSDETKKSSKRPSTSQTSVSSAVATPVSPTALQVSAKKRIAQISYAVKCATIASRDSKLATIGKPSVSGSSNHSIRHISGSRSAHSDIDNAENFTRVTYRRKNVNKPIALEVKNNINTKILPKLAYLHVYKMNPRMTVEKLESILIDSFPEVVVEKLTQCVRIITLPSRFLLILPI
ncbi:hypothetical protein JTB14_036595 [Gonioctena quinquepunctata]|nr:hypothetical protein JTB14_036595 [Gonioctena quinquepunctata]